MVQADWVRFGVTSRVEAPQQAGSGQGGDQGEPSGSSLGDAAKSAWEKIKKGW